MAVSRQHLIDDVTKSLIAIDHVHHEIHDGDHYFAGLVATKGIAESLDLLIVTPNSAARAHFASSIRVTNIASAYLYEGVTASAAGTAMTEFNSNRNSSSTAGVVVTHTPTITDTGTLLMSVGLSDFQNSAAESHDDDELVLKANTKYLVRVTSGANGNVITVKINWYEHTQR